MYIFKYKFCDEKAFFSPSSNSIATSYNTLGALKVFSPVSEDPEVAIEYFSFYEIDPHEDLQYIGNGEYRVLNKRKIEDIDEKLQILTK